MAVECADGNAGSKYYLTITRKRYDQLKDAMQSEFGDELCERIMQCMRATFPDFDPYLPQYTPERGRKQNDARKRAAAQAGMSVRAYLASRHHVKAADSTTAGEEAA